MSIGFDWHGARKETRQINGADVVCIVDAHLFEISYLHGFRAGVVKDAFATLQDVDYSKSLREVCGNGKFLYEGAAIGVTRALQDIINRT